MKASHCASLLTFVLLAHAPALSAQERGDRSILQLSIVDDRTDAPLGYAVVVLARVNIERFTDSRERLVGDPVGVRRDAPTAGRHAEGTGQSAAAARRAAATGTGRPATDARRVATNGQLRVRHAAARRAGETRVRHARMGAAYLHAAQNRLVRGLNDVSWSDSGVSVRASTVNRASRPGRPRSRGESTPILAEIGAMLKEHA